MVRFEYPPPPPLPWGVCTSRRVKYRLDAPLLNIYTRYSFNSKFFNKIICKLRGNFKLTWKKKDEDYFASFTMELRLSVYLMSYVPAKVEIIIPFPTAEASVKQANIAKPLLSSERDSSDCVPSVSQRKCAAWHAECIVPSQPRRCPYFQATPFISLSYISIYVAQSEEISWCTTLKLAEESIN